MKIIDPHLHLFDLQQGDYQWLQLNKAPFWPDKKKIARDFSERDLTLTQPLELSAFVHIEAGFNNKHPEQEIHWLEQTCARPFVSIVGIDLSLDSRKFSQQITNAMQYKSVVGVRYILDEQAFKVLSNTQTVDNLTLLNGLEVIFEVQMSLTDHAAVDTLSELINKNNHITFIINHAGFPNKNSTSVAWQNWQKNLRKLAEFEQVAIKLSGWEMIDRHYQQLKISGQNIDWQSYIMQWCLSTFGKKRVMLASNFPLCLFSHSNYQAYWQNLLNSDFIQTLTEHEQHALFFENSHRYYFC